MEDAAVEAEGDHALLDAGAGTVVDADQRAAGLDGQFLDFDDLLAVDLTEAATEHGGVLAEDADVAAVDGAVTSDHAVAGGAVLLQTEVLTAVLGERIEFDEGVLVKQREDPLSGGELALGVHPVHGFFADRVERLFSALAQIGELPRSGVDVDLVLGSRLSHARHGLMLTAASRPVASGLISPLERWPSQVLGRQPGGFQNREFTYGHE